MRTALMLLALLFLAAAGVVAAPGPCGDVNDDDIEWATMGDVTVLIAYLFMGGSLPAPDDSDVDGKEGITYADEVALIDHLFTSYQPLDCSASGRYDYTLIMEDTVIMPLARCIPPDVNSVTLDIDLRLNTNNVWMYLPFDPMAPGSSDNFEFTSATGGAVVTDPGGLQVLAQSYVGTSGGTIQLHYDRVDTGFGEIFTGVRDINTYKRYAVVTGFTTGTFDLRRPVVVACWQYDYPEGDLNCNCQVTLGDLVIMNDGLFGSLVWPSPCPCAF